MKNESEQLEKIKELYSLVKNNQFDPSNFQLIVKTNQYLIKEFNKNFKLIYSDGEFKIVRLDDDIYKDTISKNRFLMVCAITGACYKGINFTYNNNYQFKILNVKSNILEVYINDLNFCFDSSIRFIIKSIILLNSITKIDEFEFSFYKSLTSINIPNSVTSIGYNAFFGCTSLTSIIVPDQRTAEVILENNPKVKDLIKIQPVNESKYSKQQLLEAINYWTNVLNESRTIRSIPFRKTKKFLK